MTCELSVDLPSKPSFPTTVTILRYGTTSLKTTDTVWHSKARIAKLLQVDYEDVCDVLAPHEGHACSRRRRQLKRPRSTLTTEQAQWLVQPATLDAMLRLSLQRRLTAFRSEFPDQSITMYRLRQTYARHKVKQRVLQWNMLLTAAQQERYQKQRRQILP